MYIYIYIYIHNKHNKLTDSNTIIAGDFNTTPTLVDRSSKQKPKGKSGLNDTLGHMDLQTYSEHLFHPTAAEYTFFSSAQGTFSKIDKRLGHKSGLNKCKKI